MGRLTGINQGGCREFSDIPLNDYGIYLAGETAKGLRDVAFDLAYTSPLIRAKKTAEVILGSRETPLIEDAAIKEMGFGVYEGMCISGEAKARESAEFNKFFTDTAHFIPARGGESVEGLLARTGAFYRNCAPPKRIRRRRSCCPHTALR